MMKVKELSVFFPAYNEEANIEAVVTKAAEILPKIAKKWEILVVNDGSTDRTGEIVQGLIKKEPRIRMITHTPNRGYGAALKTGLYNSRYDLIIFTDADGQFDFSEITKFLEKIEEADLAIGYRLKRKDPLIRKMIAFLLKVWNFVFFRVWFRDADCGFKLIKRSVLDKIGQLKTESAITEVEFLMKAKRAGFKIVEVGVSHYPRKEGRQTGGNIKVILKAAKETFDLLRLPFLVFILLVAGFLRLYRIADYMTFLGDEGRDVLVVKRIIVDHKLTLLGPTASVGGFFLGPIYYYFMLPFLWLFRLNPVGPAVMVALFGIATVYLVYKIGQEFFDQKTGLFAASLYALSPLVIAYSRSSWNPNLVPFFALFYVYSLYQIIKTESWRWWFVSGLSIGIGLQLHYLFTFLIPMGMVFLLMTKKGLSFLKLWALKFLGVIIGWLPFIAFELRHRFPNIKALYNFVFHSEETGFVSIKFQERIGEIIFRLFSRLVFYFPPPEQYYWYSKNLLFVWKALIVLVIIAALFSLIIQIIKEKKPSHLLLILWLVFGTGLFLGYQKEIYDYYLGIMFPLPFLLVGNLISFLWTKKILKPLAILFFGGLIMLNWYGRPFKFPANRQLAQTQKIAQIVFDNTEGRPFNFALITGQNSDHAYRYFLEIWGAKPVTIENFANDPQRETVTDQLLVVCEVPADKCRPLGHPLWEIAGFGRAKIVNQWSAPGGVTIIKLEHWQGEAGS